MNTLATLIRLAIGAGLAAVVLAQAGATLLTLLVLAFLVTVIWSPLTRHQEVS